MDKNRPSYNISLCQTVVRFHFHLYSLGPPVSTQSTFRKWPNLPTRRSPTSFPTSKPPTWWQGWRSGRAAHIQQANRPSSRDLWCNSPAKAKTQQLDMGKIWCLCTLLASSHASIQEYRMTDDGLFLISFWGTRVESVPTWLKLFGKQGRIGRINPLVCIAMQLTISKDGASTTSYPHNAI